ncbi:plasmid mobilization relaxosome protein MobC [Alkalihalobacillus sp. NPDC078783]
MSKNKEIKFRLTVEEKERADKFAEYYEMTINALAKFLTLNLSMPQNPETATAYKDLSIQVGAIGNNVNQIARKVNRNNSFTRSEREEILKALSEIRNDTRALVGKEPVEEIKATLPPEKKRSIFTL